MGAGPGKIPMRLIPKSQAKYGIDNPWKYNFHKSWRLMDTVAGDGENVIALIIEWLFAQRVRTKVRLREKPGNYTTGCGTKRQPPDPRVVLPANFIHY